MYFKLMGPFEIATEDGRTYRPATPKVCQTLALLLTRPNEIVTADSLIQELWGSVRRAARSRRCRRTCTTRAGCS